MPHLLPPLTRVFQFTFHRLGLRTTIRLVTLPLGFLSVFLPPHLSSCFSVLLVTRRTFGFVLSRACIACSLLRGDCPISIQPAFLHPPLALGEFPFLFNLSPFHPFPFFFFRRGRLPPSHTRCRVYCPFLSFFPWNTSRLSSGSLRPSCLVFRFVLLFFLTFLEDVTSFQCLFPLFASSLGRVFPQRRSLIQLIPNSDCSQERNTMTTAHALTSFPSLFEPHIALCSGIAV